MLRLRLGTWPGVSPQVVRLILAGQDVLQCAARLARREGGGLARRAAASCVPIFDVLDRLDRQVVVPLPFEGRSEDFWYHVLPTTNVEANFVRGFMRIHCDQAFMNLLRDRRGRSPPGSPFLVVEVGAHLGGCTFFALTHLDQEISAVAIEPYGPAAAAMRRTAALNGLAGRLEVSESYICEESGSVLELRRKLSAAGRWLSQPVWAAPDEAAAHPADLLANLTDVVVADERHVRARCVRLGELLRAQGVAAVDVLRVHVSGRELSVLRSASALLEAC